MSTDEQETTEEQETIDTTTNIEENNADTGTSNTGDEDQNKPLNMTQEQFNAHMAKRAGQAKRNAIGDLLKEHEFENVDQLNAAMESFKKFEEKRLAAEEEQKTELQKQKDLYDKSVAYQAKQAAVIRTLQIESAVQKIAPKKNVPPNHFDALIKLMPISELKATDGEIADADIEAAIDATLEVSKFLVVNSTESQHGSPTGEDDNSQISINIDKDDARFKKMKKRARF